jgi:hypothetical protein
MEQKNRSKTKKKLSKLNGGGNNHLTQSMRNHPTYKKPELRLLDK